MANAALPGGPPPKKKTSSLVIVLGVVGVGFVLLLLVGGLVVWKVMSTPEGRAIVGMVGEVARITQKAQSAPGTKELRAAGCKQALVMGLDDIAKMAGRFDAAPPPESESVFGSMVVCAAGPFSTPPSCDEIARTYVRAAGKPAKHFLVTVSQTGKKDPTCTGIYDHDGAKVEDGALDVQDAIGDDAFDDLPPLEEEPPTRE